MGSNCLSGKKSKSELETNLAKKGSQDKSGELSRQILPQSGFETPLKGSGVSNPSTAISTSGIGTPENIHQKTNPEDIASSSLKKQDPSEAEDLEDIFKQVQNTRSSIIRLPSKRHKSSQAETTPQKVHAVIENFKDCSKISGELSSEKIESKIVISHEEIDIELMLPRCRAGPIVVPFIEYDRYTSQA